MRSSGIAGACPVYIRAVSNTISMPCRATSARAAVCGSGMSRNTGSSGAARLASTPNSASAMDSPSANSGPLPAAATAAHHAVALQPPAIEPAERHSLPLCEPGAQEGRSRRREEGLVVPFHGGERHAGQRNHARVVHGRRGALALEPHVPPRQRETGLAVVVLLRDHAVQPDLPSGRRGHAVLPERPAEAAAAPFGQHDVQPQEGERAAVPDHGERCDRPLVQQADEEAAGVRRMEALRILQSRIPAFHRRPLDRERDLLARHGAAAVARGHGAPNINCPP